MSSLPPFDIRRHFDKLEPDGGSHSKHEGSYFCPVCGAKNFKVDLNTSQYSGFSCHCTDTDAGKRKVRAAIAPLSWEKPYRSQNKRIWTYFDKNGCPLIEVHRVDDGKGVRKFWQESLQEKKRPSELKSYVRPYRYQECQKAIQDRQYVFWVEGEPCADALWQLGIPATTTIGGSKNYRSEQYQNLFPAELIVICPDRDLHGLKYAQSIAVDYPSAQWCYPFPNSILWNRITSSDGADIVDWIEEGATKEQILAAVGTQRNLQIKQKASPKKAREEKPNQFKLAYHQIESLWSDQLRFNDFTKQIELDSEVIELGDFKVELAIKENLDVSLDKLELILSHLAKQHRYHPVQNYLTQCYEKYSDTSILDALAQKYFGCTNTIYNTFLKRTLIAAVARVFSPGCKVDTALILQGKQGFHKSSFFKLLAGPEYFDDSLGTISDKDEKLKLHQTWIAEWAELENVFKRRDIAATKSFLSSSIDVVRPPYGKQSVRMERQSIIVGTTNQDEFLSDSTGNRRFWVIPVEQPIDLECLKRDRDLIWGAAVAVYRHGEQWWLTDREEQQAHKLIENYLTGDPWQSRIEAHLIEWRLNKVTATEILNNCLEIEPSRQSRSDMMRVADCLKLLGWQHTRQTYQGKRRRVWVEPDQPTQPRASNIPEDGTPSNPHITSISAGVGQPGQPVPAHFEFTEDSDALSQRHAWEVSPTDSQNNHGAFTARQLE